MIQDARRHRTVSVPAFRHHFNVHFDVSYQFIRLEDSIHARRHLRFKTTYSTSTALS